MAGCSVDTVEDQQAFSDKNNLSYPLIADPDAEIAKAYEVYKDDWKLAGRATAVIGEDRTVLKTYPKAPLSGEGHVPDVYRDVRKLLEL